MKPLLSALVATTLLTGVVYAAAATGTLTDRPLAALGVLMIGVGLVRHHREREPSAPANVRATADRSPRR